MPTVEDFQIASKGEKLNALAGTGEHVALKEIERIKARRKLILGQSSRGDTAINTSYDPAGKWDDQGRRVYSGPPCRNTDPDIAWQDLVGFVPPIYAIDQIRKNAKLVLKTERKSIYIRKKYMDALHRFAENIEDLKISS